jgi:hypothetical protein
VLQDLVGITSLFVALATESKNFPLADNSSIADLAPALTNQVDGHIKPIKKNSQLATEDRTPAPQEVVNIASAEASYPNPEVAENIVLVGGEDMQGVNIDSAAEEPAANSELDYVPEIERVKFTPKRWLLALFVIIVGLAVILAVGLGVGLTNKKGSNSASSKNPQSPSAPPTPLHSDAPQQVDRLSAVIDFLELHNISSPASLSVIGSPQYKAALWIANDDPLQLNSTLQSTFLQRYVLVVIYYAFNGEKWNRTLGWLRGDSECSWSVTIDGIFEGAVCNSAGALTDLYLGKYEVIIFL